MRATLCVTVVFAFLLAGVLSPAAQAEPMWTTYHRDAQRSGYDPEATQPIEPQLAWQSVDLGAPIWSQPLVLGDLVYVATVADEVYALEASTGKVVWQKSVGTPVPSDELPCGDIEPTVGVVGTPVIDLELGAFFVVADRWNQITKEAEHRLVGLSLASGEEMVSTNVDPPGADPKALLQRTALNLDKGEVIFGYGGNDGDCSDYQGAVVAAPANGGTPRFWQYQPALPSLSGGAVWAPAGPAVGEEGDVYATTGNPDPPDGKRATEFDYSDSVVKLDLAQDFVARPASEPTSPFGWFEPPNWEEESNNDLDLSSAAAELLPGGLLFQAGKDGVGYLIDEATMNSDHTAVFKAQVCKGDGSFGGDAFAGGILYIACTNGTQALAYNETARTFTALWQGPADAFGPPIVSAGLVWTVATGAFKGGGTKLYGLEPATGTPRYTETLPSPVIDHFASPSAAGGRLFVASGSSVTAYQVAQLPPTSSGSTSTTSTPTGSNTVKVEAPTLLVRTRLRASRAGIVHLALRCTIKPGSCKGAIAIRAILIVKRGSGHHRVFRTVLILLAGESFGPKKGDFSLTMHLDRHAMTLLRHHHDHLNVQVRISAPGYLARQVQAVLR
ncbi:MAG TPA: PQQ-binding-like beta-propeller repeat protein [Solirubrobacteraceae bacterium]|jgi:polyvinyl alcohol dehydrogenase (cytochrome)|nr:PQQ-binding-like beta-propeller repeat protein [Solirubrobacteraceae bacterium]